MAQNLPLADNDPVAEGFFDAVQEVLSGLLVNFEPVILDATTIRLPAGAGDKQVSISIGGEYRWVTANIDRAHPGGAAGTYDLCATSLNNAANAGRPAGNDSSFNLAIVAENAAPAGVGRYTVTHKIAWSGAAITALVPVARFGQRVPLDKSVTAAKLAALAVGTAALADQAVTAAKLADALRPSVGVVAAGTEALRALGTTASTAAAGNDARLSDKRVPQDASVTDLTVPNGGLSPIKIAGTAVVTADPRLSDARTPTAHNHDDRYYTEGEINTQVAALFGVKGRIDGSTGAILQGAGFTAARTGAGVYQIVFTTPFAVKPFVPPPTVIDGLGFAANTMISNHSANTVTFRVFTSAGAAVDVAELMFEAVAF